MKVLLINGSVNEKGCTNQALEIIRDQLKEEGIEGEIVWIGNEAINDFVPGNAHPEKVKGDDIVHIIGEKCKTADGFVVGSPTYYAHPNARLLCFLDNLSKDYGPYLSHKPATSVLSARRAGQVASFDVINKHFSINNMPIVTSTYWNLVFGSRPEEVLQDREGVLTMINIAKNMAWLLKSIQAGKEKGIEVPTCKKEKTNFHR